MMEEYVLNKIIRTLIIYTLLLFIVLFAVCGGIMYAISKLQVNEPIDFEPIMIYEYKMPTIELPKQELKDDEKELINLLEQRAFDLTNSYIGIGGDCFKISMQFIKEIKGIENPEYIEINEEESITGDVIFYESNGKGETHYAVKLNNNIAFQPNWEGKAKIGKIHYDKFSNPIFYKVVEKEGME